jgi:hypothetical protein
VSYRELMLADGTQLGDFSFVLRLQTQVMLGMGSSASSSRLGWCGGFATWTSDRSMTCNILAVNILYTCMMPSY